jgi:hypothetical protein
MHKKPLQRWLKGLFIYGIYRSSMTHQKGIACPQKEAV